MFRVKILLLLLVLSLAGCAQSNNTVSDSVGSFLDMSKATHFEIGYDEFEQKHILKTSSGISLLLTADTRETTTDSELDFSIKPFVVAGLSTENMDANYLDLNLSVLGLKFKSTIPESPFEYKSVPTLKETLEQMKANYSGMFYSPDGGKTFVMVVGQEVWMQWQADGKSGCRIIVDPDKLIFAGVDPAKLSDWKYESFKLKDLDGNPIEKKMFVLDVAE